MARGRNDAEPEKRAGMVGTSDTGHQESGPGYLSVVGDAWAVHTDLRSATRTGIKAAVAERHTTGTDVPCVSVSKSKLGHDGLSSIVDNPNGGESMNKIYDAAFPVMKHSVTRYITNDALLLDHPYWTPDVQVLFDDALQSWRINFVNKLVAKHSGVVSHTVPKTWWDHLKQTHGYRWRRHAQRVARWFDAYARFIGLAGPGHDYGMALWARRQAHAIRQTWSVVNTETKYWDVTSVLPHFQVPSDAGQFVNVMIAEPCTTLREGAYVVELDDAVAIPNPAYEHVDAGEKFFGQKGLARCCVTC